MGKKKRHHYIPQFYLRGFIDPANEPYLWVYEKRSPAIKSVSARDAGLEKGYHSFTNSKGQRDTESIENIFQRIEDSTARVFEGIKNREPLSEEERHTLATFLSLMLTRVPNYRRNVENTMGDLLKQIAMMDASNIDWLRENMKTYEQVTGESLGMSPEEFQKTILEGDYELSTSPTFSLQMMSIDLSEAFLDKTWFYLKATDRVKFLTSDNPLSYHDPTRKRGSYWPEGLADENTEVTFPISKELALVATRRKGVGPGYVPVSHQVVKDINRRTVMSALRFVYSSQKSGALNRLVQRYVNSASKMGVGWPRAQV
jgi:hypothetical protein